MATATLNKKRRSPKEELEYRLTQFSSNLDMAREIYSRYPELVSTEQLPEPFASAPRDWKPGDFPGELGDTLLIERGVLPVTPEQASSAARLPKLSGQAYDSVGMRLSAERLIELVNDRFEDFLESASYLDLQVMSETLDWHASKGLLNGEKTVLADAFAQALGIELDEKATGKPH